ncbi:ScbA/BarX family gamma-butyrolactone biosynthesis protein [Streptomyces sp. NBC_01549]|uniref:ScbA/BarX family gamma-butyrolactone biosynthesis protein n=1 Tax=Streptomyces sp. NBC_01549 TaxID=2975874 RepID=UPI002255DA62|nr:ScbA/BarX family gamma-butyrolactone biosynthesis protein [Streptomyces sp. NBC_01549]MCX4591814.1 ScbA/BarX family gamma-butyrolactone biosynthesis protein [Streptomyces sp. NBC_01549]
MVHRSDPSDIFPTGWSRCGDNNFCVSAQWPGPHRFFAVASGLDQDPLLIAETMRQTTMMLAHAEFGVPVDDHFVMWDLEYSAVVPGFGLDTASGKVLIDVTYSDVRRRGRGIAGMRVALRFYRDGALLATSSGRVSCTSARAYRRIRRDRLDVVGRPIRLLPGLAPSMVGRTADADVVLAPTPQPQLWRLRLDTTNPTLFRRPNDHVPGIVLLEAARQAAVAAAPGQGFLPTSAEIAFHRYVELDCPCWIEAELAPSADGCGTTVRVRGQQDGKPVFTSELTHVHQGGRS